MALSDEQLAMDLAAAVENYAAVGTGSSPVPQAIADGLDNLLYGCGGDGVLELSVSSEAGCLAILGIVIWVEEQTLGPLEAEFQLDKAGRAVQAFTIRAGDGRISRRDAPSYPQSWRAVHRIIAGRPTADEDWTEILHHNIA